MDTRPMAGTPAQPDRVQEEVSSAARFRLRVSTAPLVTVGIPFYNASSTLYHAVRSVFAQTYTNWELLQVDDGSTDDSLVLAHQISDPRVTIVEGGRNRGISFRLNQ